MTECWDETSSCVGTPICGGYGCDSLPGYSEFVETRRYCKAVLYCADETEAMGRRCKPPVGQSVLVK